MENQLQTIVDNSGLEKSKAEYILENFQDYFEVAAAWEKKAKMIKVTNASQTADMKMARVGRLELREKRISVEKSRKKLKEQALREGKAIDGIANVLKALIVPIEEYLEQQEKFVEIQEEKKREAMRIEAEKREEEERIRLEQMQKLHAERKEIILPYREWWPELLEKTNLGELSQEDFDNIVSSLKTQKEDYDKEQERVRIENERLKKEAEEKERKHREEQALAEAKAKKEREEAEAKQRAIEEKAEKARREAEAKQKAVEEKARIERERIEAEKRASEEAARKEKERLENELKNQIECPKCHHKFQRKP